MKPYAVYSVCVCACACMCARVCVCPAATMDHLTFLGVYRLCVSLWANCVPQITWMTFLRNMQG